MARQSFKRAIKKIIPEAANGFAAHRSGNGSPFGESLLGAFDRALIIFGGAQSDASQRFAIDGGKLFDDFATPWSVCRPPRAGVNGIVTATVAMIVMEPALGVMEVAPLPALDRRFTTYRLEASRGAAVAVAG